MKPSCQCFFSFFSLLREQFFGAPNLEPSKAFETLNSRRLEIRKETEKCLSSLIVSPSDAEPRHTSDVTSRHSTATLRQADLSDDSDATTSSKSSSSTIVKKPTRFLRQLSVTPPPEPASSPPPLEPLPVERIVPIRLISKKLRRNFSVESPETETDPSGDPDQAFTSTLSSETKDELSRKDFGEKDKSSDPIVDSDTDVDVDTLNVDIIYNDNDNSNMSLWDSRAAQVMEN